MRLKSLVLTAAAVLLAANTASAVEFKASGEWFVGFGGVESTFLQNNNGGNDVFQAMQRYDLELEVIVSESLSGVLGLRIGDLAWGRAEDGGALGTDGVVVKVHSAYLNWAVPGTELRLQMGLMGVALPNAAGGSAIWDEQTAGVVANYAFNDTVGLTAFWLRPFNDNYTNANGYVYRTNGRNPDFYLDNADYFGLSLPLTFDGVEVTPWAMIGMVGKNALDAADADGEAVWGDTHAYSLPQPFATGTVEPGSWTPRGHAYRTEFYAGLPVVISAFDPFTFEFDFNYGYASSMGKYSVADRRGVVRRADTRREGWLVKALAEYKLEWGTPGIFAWYASGDDGDIRNGSERMPTVLPTSTFTSFMQDGENGWSLNGGYDRLLQYGGTWGIGLQLKDVSFVEDLKHTLRVAYWGGTNSEGMIRHITDNTGWGSGGIYLTTRDHLIEANLDTTWQIYENLEAVVELGYIVNGIDRSAWRKNMRDVPTPAKADAWKAALIMKYSF